MEEEVEELLGNNRLEDVNWLCSLSESELEMLISLKIMIHQRAKRIGHDDLAKKFDLKMLRALGLILMECLRGQIKDLSLIPGMDKSAAFIDSCNLLKCNLDDITSMEELKECIGIDSRKRSAKRGRDGSQLQEKGNWNLKTKS